MSSREARSCTVLIAEDHAVARSGLEFLLSREDGFELVGNARDGDEAVALVAELRPDILILDLMLPRRSGSRVLASLQASGAPPRVVVLSGQLTGRDCEALLDAGVCGVVSKEDSSEELIRALHAVRDGDRFLSSAVRGLLGPLDRTLSGDAEVLTAREREILAHVAEGLSSGAIGARLGISLKTVKKHRENIRRKLDVSNVVEATRAAARLGLTKLS